MIGPLELPDIPRWVEAHGIAADPQSWRQVLGDGFAVGNDRARLVVVAGNASAAAVAALAAARPAHSLLVAFERADLAAATGRQVARAVLHTLPAEPPGHGDREHAAHPGPLADGEPGAVELPPEVSLAHLPPALAEELAAARPHRTIWAAFLDDAPVAFAYAPWRSARWFDVSVDVLPGARQLGLGRLVAAAMIRGEQALGRAPVWGADEGNAASLRLARALGFVAVDEVWVAA